jgi:single-strand DNA-binding protein
MALQINRVMLAGNLTRDPQLRFLGNEKAVADFGLAINRRFKTADGQMKEEVTFVDVEAWGRTAELVGQYLTKGRACFVEGRLRLDTWDDKKDGQKRSKLRVIADNVQFIDSNRDRGQGAAPGEAEMTEAGESNAPAPTASPASTRTATSAPAAAPAPADDEPPF